MTYVVHSYKENSTKYKEMQFVKFLKTLRAQTTIQNNNNTFILYILYNHNYIQMLKLSIDS